MFAWFQMQRWQYVRFTTWYPETLCLIKSELDMNAYNFENLLFSIMFLKKWPAHFFCRRAYRNYKNYTLLSLEKWHYLPHYWSDKGYSIMWIEHCHLCIECHLKLCLQSLKNLKFKWIFINWVIYSIHCYSFIWSRTKELSN